MLISAGANTLEVLKDIVSNYTNILNTYCSEFGFSSENDFSGGNLLSLFSTKFVVKSVAKNLKIG